MGWVGPNPVGKLWHVTVTSAPRTGGVADGAVICAVERVAGDSGRQRPMKTRFTLLLTALVAGATSLLALILTAARN